MAGDVTQLLNANHSSGLQDAEELLPLVYEELRKLAKAKMAALPPGQTLQATALVHDAYLRLLGSGPQSWNSRGHFFAAAAEAMRRILVERARQKASQKRGGGFQRVDLDHVDVAGETSEEVLLALDEALQRYAEKDPTGAELIKLRFFIGLSNPHAAEILGLSERTAKRTWAYARAWLLHDLQKQI